MIARNVSVNRATSSNALLTVIPDNLPPEIVSAYTTEALSSVLVSFNEHLDPVTANTLGNYVITNGLGQNIPLASATLTNGTNVLLLTQGQLPLGKAVVVINDVADIASIPNVIADNSAVIIGFRGLIIDQSDEWRFDDTHRNWLSETEWLNLGFNDADWSTGGGTFIAIENGNPAGEGLIPPFVFTTEMDYIGDPPEDYITNYYFRTRINLPGGMFGTVIVTNIMDDGGVFYLNGQEVARFGMPAGDPTFTTLASRNEDVDDRGPDVFTVPASSFVAGDNIIAVTVHQVNGTSSDSVFGSQWFLDAASQVLPPPASDCPDLEITRQGSQVQISWPAESNCTLIQASDPAGPWSAVPGATNPYTVTPGPSNPMKFYQLRQ